ncbi:hypothetical protein GCM10020254_61740 [Streptomyces goshikiensis]
MPRNEEPSVTAEHESTPTPDADQSHVPPLTTRVVIAEDEALIRLDLKEMLEEEGTPSSVRPETGRRPSSWPGSTARTW